MGDKMTPELLQGPLAPLRALERHCVDTCVSLKELLVELGWARKTRVKVEEEESGSAQAERGSGDDCDDEDGCAASGDEDSGESCDR